MIRGSDSLRTQVDAWRGESDRISALQQEWQDLEHKLFTKAKREGISCERAVKLDWPEARAMHTLDEKVHAAQEALDASALTICRMRACNVRDAIAKVSLGLLVQGPFDWRPNALALVEGGLKDLKALIEGDQSTVTLKGTQQELGPQPKPASFDDAAEGAAGVPS